MGPNGGRGMMGGRGPAGMVGAPAAKPKHFKKTMKTMWSYMKPHKVRLLFVVIFAVVSTVFLILGPRILGNMTTEVVDGYVAGQAYDKLVGALPKGTKIPAGKVERGERKQTASEASKAD